MFSVVSSLFPTLTYKTIDLNTGKEFHFSGYQEAPVVEEMLEQSSPFLTGWKECGQVAGVAQCKKSVSFWGRR